MYPERALKCKIALEHARMRGAMGLSALVALGLGICTVI